MCDTCGYYVPIIKAFFQRGKMLSKEKDDIKKIVLLTELRIGIIYNLKDNILPIIYIHNILYFITHIFYYLSFSKTCTSSYHNNKSTHQFK